MAVLTSARRSRLRSSVFGLPGQRKYPMPDKSHAANAKARATQMYKRGRLSAAQRRAIFAKANRILGMQHGGVVPGSDMDYKTLRGKVMNFGRTLRDRFHGYQTPSTPPAAAPAAPRPPALSDQIQRAQETMGGGALKRREAQYGLARGGMVSPLRKYKNGRIC